MQFIVPRLCAAFHGLHSRTVNAPTTTPGTRFASFIFSSGSPPPDCPARISQDGQSISSCSMSAGFFRPSNGPRVFVEAAATSFALFRLARAVESSLVQIQFAFDASQDFIADASFVTECDRRVAFHTQRFE